MSSNPVSVGGRRDTADFRQELLGRLGLQASANDQDVEMAHNGLVEFLELAPHEMKTWAVAQTADVDEAFALLSGPEQDLVAQTPVAAMAQQTPVQTFSSPPAAPAAPGAFGAFVANRQRRNRTLGAIGAVLIIGVIFLVSQMGKGSDVPGISGTPTGQETTAAASGPAVVPVDKAKVAALMTKIAANPKDVVSLQGLGDIYFAASDYKNASAWAQKVIAVDPKNEKALIGLGAAQFNLGNKVEAKKNWLVAAGLYPKNAEVHYDLGFYYMSQTPPDSVNMQAEWKKVVAIDPNSALAKSVQTHITGTKTPAPTAK